MSSSLTLRCPICSSSDVVIIELVIGGITGQYYHCNECEFEWQVPSSPASESEETQKE